MNENIFVSAPINSIVSLRKPDRTPLATVAATFELKSAPLAARGPRTILADVKPFKNVALVVYESVTCLCL